MLKYASISKVGNRKYNEDFVKVSTVANRSCFVVCDGLGGHELGDRAAQMAGNTFIDELYYCESVPDFMKSSFAIAQRKIHQYRKDNDIKSDMKTTAVCLVSDEIYMYVGHVGDSRFYGFKRSGGYIRTYDHSIPQILVQSGSIEESQIRNHPNRNMLLKALGDKTDEELCELQEPLNLQEFSAMLLCSDGFWELIDEEKMIKTLLDSFSAKDWLDKMIEIVEANGNGREMDNYSAIAILN